MSSAAWARKTVGGFRELAGLMGRVSRDGIRRRSDRLLHRGWHRRALDMDHDRVVLLFFADVEPGNWTRHARRALRRLVHASRGAQRASGFETAFRGLVRAIEAAGWVPVVGDFALARANPTYPVGLAGYPHILDRWPLVNPTVLGPGMFDHPALRPDLFRDERFRSYIVPCEWMRRMFEPVYGDRVVTWYSPVDLTQWPDYSAEAEKKDIDFLVYDKIHWDRERVVSTVLAPVLAELEARALRSEVLRYGSYNLAGYRSLLRRAKAMIFLGENETQGLAYQEAMATNTPILAWDNGHWLDPQRTRYTADPVAASSVPFFDPTCGETFPTPAAFPDALERFLERAARSEFSPRSFVERVLSPAVSSGLYLDAYRSAANGAATHGAGRGQGADNTGR